MTGFPKTEGCGFLLKGFMFGMSTVASSTIVGSLLMGELLSHIARSARQVLLLAGDKDRPTAPTTAHAPRIAASPTFRRMPLRLFPRESVEFARDSVGDGTYSDGLFRFGRPFRMSSKCCRPSATIPGRILLGEQPGLPLGLARLEARTGPWHGPPDGIEDPVPVLLESVSVRVRQPSENVLPDTGDE